MSTPDQPLSGRIESLRFERLLARFWLRGFSGSFRARGSASTGPRASKEVLFERGRIAWAASDDPQDSIRTHLIQRGILRSEQWRLAQERSGPAHPRQALVEMGFLTARELHDADRERVCGILLSIFNWVEGDYAVSPSPLPPGTPNLQIDPRDLVLEGIMASGDRDRVLEAIGSLDAVLIVRPDELARASLSLPVEITGLMEKADGTRTVAEICALSPLQDFMICAAFAGLKVLELATESEAGARPAPPAPPRAPAPRRVARPAPRLVEPGRAGSGAAAPRLPLGEEFDDGATTPVAATPPGGVAAVGALRRELNDHDEEDDHGTIPLVVTPAGGSPALPRVDDPLDEDDPGTRPVTATPPGGTPTVRDDHEPPAGEEHGIGTAEDATREITGLAREVAEGMEDREGEVDLTPGIPVPPSPAGGREIGLLPDEIECVVQIFSTSTPPEEPEAPAPLARPGDSPLPSPEPAPVPPPLHASHDQGRTTDPLMLSGEGDLEEPEPPEEIDPGIGDAPTWIYEPSGARPPARAHAPWVKWAGIAAGLFAVGTIVTLFFGSGSPGPGSAQAVPRDQAGPPVVDVPSSPAIEGEPARTPAVHAGRATEEPPVRPAPAAASAEAPAAEMWKPSLAAPADGNILLSGPFRDARTLLAAGRLREAARGFEASLAGRRGLYTVQLALACSPETVARASRSTGGAAEFFILPKEFDGRACYRLLWGAFPARNNAESARGSVPRAFTQGRDAPFVAPI